MRAQWHTEASVCKVPVYHEGQQQARLREDAGKGGALVGRKLALLAAELLERQDNLHLGAKTENIVAKVLHK